MEVATHFIHPDEISPQSLMIIADLVKNGIAVYVQTPFLNNCNDEGPELVRLFSLLRGAGAELHYIYIPCSPIHGNSVYWSPISKGLAVGNYLRAHLSDRVIPRICTATPIGKDGLAYQRLGRGAGGRKTSISSGFERHTRPRISSVLHRLPTIWKIYGSTTKAPSTSSTWRKSGMNRSFWGRAAPIRWRCSGSAGKYRCDTAFGPRREKIAPSIVDTGSSTISRVHETRVEMDADAVDEDFDIIRGDDRITDVVIVAANDAVDPCLESAGSCVHSKRSPTSMRCGCAA
jgi:lysine 2,3-aminomutase